MSNLYRACLVAAGLVGLCSQARADVMTSVTQSTSPPATGLTTSYTGVTTLTFDGSLALPAGFSGGGVVAGTSDPARASPNGDSSNYFAVGLPPSNTGSATFTPGGEFNYLGLYWGSIDSFNSVTFSLANTVVATYTGSAFPPASGNQTAANTNEYVNFLFSPGTGYDTVTFSTSSANFEFDNLAYGNVSTAVPEPASIALLATGFIGLVGVARSKRKKSISA